MKKKRLAYVKRALRHMSPRHIVKSRLTSGTVERFAERIGLVYLGHVDQKDDDHRLVRGNTVSASHIDTNYSVGSIKGYDVALVSRNDVRLSKNLKNEIRCHWLIATIDLKTSVDIPHLYIGHSSHTVVDSPTLSQLSPLASSASIYPKQFLDHYIVYTRPTHAAYVSLLIENSIAEVITSHFEHTSIEVDDNCVYLYIESKHPSESQLQKIISNGIWIAEAIDMRSRQLKTAGAPE